MQMARFIFYFIQICVLVVCLLLYGLGVLLCLWYSCSSEQEPAKNQFFTESDPIALNLFLLK